MNKHNCKHYCPDYATCTRSKCDRVALFPRGQSIIMVEPDSPEVIKENLYMKKRLYNEPRLLKLN